MGVLSTHCQTRSLWLSLKVGGRLETCSQHRSCISFTSSFTWVWKMREWCWATGTVAMVCWWAPSVIEPLASPPPGNLLFCLPGIFVGFPEALAASLVLSCSWGVSIHRKLLSHSECRHTLTSKPNHLPKHTHTLGASPSHFCSNRVRLGLGLCQLLVQHLWRSKFMPSPT